MGGLLLACHEARVDKFDCIEMSGSMVSCVARYVGEAVKPAVVTALSRAKRSCRV